jgi:hypothetical protein
MRYGPLELVILALYIVWFLLSVANQFQRASRSRLAPFLSVLLVPRWTFFAPNPGHSDYFLEYRDHTEDLFSTPWQRVSVLEERTLLGAIWNPNRRQSKLLFDVTQSLQVSALAMEDPEGICVSIPYLLVMNYLDSLPVEPPCTIRQFRVVESYGFFPYKEEHLILRSKGLKLKGVSQG